MGICESCLKAQEDVETVPLLGARGDAAEAELTGAQGPIKEEETKDWHQALIDDANAQFISSNYRHRRRTNHTPEEMRLQLATAHVPFTAMLSSGGRLHEQSGLSEPQSVVDLLSEPVVVSDRLDTGSDEIAEIVSSHIRSDRHKLGRESSAVVAHLKPVALPAGGN